MTREQMYQRVLTIQTLRVQAALLKEQIDALEAELTDLARQIGAIGADGALTDLLV